ncbi:hypothetical protein K503DRAFT_802091 [Rhizopogon vinicolor AM-OR11-026]|uniref:Uncharacterized protein n=1 Tax=Rhizopogon vinicolor AM-OR11-026 TaxID=1314800 RepID=A0A1B7MUR7_9AGAM|nr:hypothetical protein K503DRAFT_802091 [Rhizopogon vinicolor AM-OR11-026]
MSAFTRMNSGYEIDKMWASLWTWHRSDNYDSSAKHPERPTIDFYDLNAQLFGPKAKSVGGQSHDVMNSLLSTESPDGGEEIEDGETDTWLDNMDWGTE